MSDPTNISKDKISTNPGVIENSDTLIKISNLNTQSNPKINLFTKCMKLFSRKKYDLLDEVTLMVTPCKHVFHPDCLKIWSERKNECPVCRKTIPCIYD